MAALFWAGVAATLAGLAILLWCILVVFRAKRANFGDDEMRARLQRVLPLNLGALFLSALGLIILIFGLVLG